MNKRHHLTTLLIVVFAFVLCLPAAASVGDTSEQTLIQVVKDMFEARGKGELEKLESLITDDWTLTLPTGMVITKQQSAAGVKAGVFKNVFPVLENFKVKMYGESAVVTFLMDKDKQTAAMLVKQEGKWKIAYGQITPIAQPKTAPK